MSPLFGNKREQAAQAAAAQAEMDRLCALPAVELAAEILPGWEPDGARRVMNNPPNALLITDWLLESYPRRPSLMPLVDPVREATAVLESASLLMRTPSNTNGAHTDLTPLGEQVLADGAVRQHLAPAPPAEPDG
jgi:hypothetical protein